VEFLYHLKSIRDATFKASSIKSAWKEAGLILYNPEVVLSKLRECAFICPQTPPPTVQRPPLLKPPSTLTTPRSVKRLITRLYTIASTLDRKEKWLYKKLLRGAYQNAYCQKLAKDNLHNIQAAVQAH
jgi:hypothetical protein